MEVIKDEFLKLYRYVFPFWSIERVAYSNQLFDRVPAATIPSRNIGALKEAETRCFITEWRELWSSFSIVPHLLTKNAHPKSIDMAVF